MHFFFFIFCKTLVTKLLAPSCLRFCGVSPEENSSTKYLTGLDAILAYGVMLFKLHFIPRLLHVHFTFHVLFIFSAFFKKFVLIFTLFGSSSCWKIYICCKILAKAIKFWPDISSWSRQCPQEMHKSPEFGIIV